MVGMWPYTHGILTAAGYTADAAVFDGVNDVLASTSALSTAANGGEGLISLWLRGNSTAGDGVAQTIMHSSGGRFQLQKTAANTIYLNIANSTDGNGLFGVYSTGTITSTDGWTHVLITWDTPGSTVELMINGVTSFSTAQVIASTLGYASGQYTFGGRTDNTERCYMDFADAYFNISTDGGGAAAILSKFYSGGKPVSLSSDGSTVTGTAPIMLLHLDNGATVTDFATNVGSGSSFSITGTLVTSTSSPTD